MNHLSNITGVNRKIGNIRVLSLRKNSIRDIGDLDKLYSLEQLDLSHNEIEDQIQIDRLGSLPLLEKLWLENNPVTTQENYRIQTFLAFGQRCKEIVLDNIGVSMTEYEHIRSSRALQAVQNIQNPSPVKRRVSYNHVSIASDSKLESYTFHYVELFGFQNQEIFEKRAKVH